MKHRPPEDDWSSEDKLRIRLRQLVIDWRLATRGGDTDAFETCADELEQLLDEQNA